MKKSVIVSYPHLLGESDRKRYRVEKVVNSVMLSPGEHISRRQVEDLYENFGYDVTIVPASK